MQRHLSKLFGGIAAAAALFGGVTAAPAAVHTYNQSSRTVNAGVLLFDSTTDSSNAVTTAAGPANFDPYMFYVLDQRLDVKPIGWSIINPLAPHTVTKDIIARWDAQATVLSSGSINTSGYTLGQQITPDMAPYWEVALSKVSLAQLRKFDILLISARVTTGQSLSITETQKEMLRQFVDGGGQIIVDAPVGKPFDDGNFLTEIGVQASTTTNISPELPDFSGVSYWHPILSTPNMLTFELADLGFSGISQTIYETGPDPINTGVLFNAGLSPTSPAIIAGQIGAGQIVLETSSMADAISSYVAPGSAFPNNRGPFCGDSILIGSVPDLKLLTNIISWNNSHDGEFGNSHNNAFTNDPVAASVRRSWSYAIHGADTARPGYGTNRTMGGSAIYGHYALVVDATGILHCFDLNPAESITGSGNPDDGIKDFNLGTEYDEVWRVDALNFWGANPKKQYPNCSAPTVAIVPDGTTVVFVTNNNGGVTGWRLSDGAVYTKKAEYTKSLTTWYYGGNNPVDTTLKTVPGYAPAPAFYRGILFSGRPDGRVFVLSYVGGTAVSPGVLMLPWTSQPFVATSPTYVTATPSAYLDSNNGINDLMLVVPTNRYVYNMHIGVYGDKLTGSGNTWNGTRQSLFTNSNIDIAAPFEVFDQLAVGANVSLDNPQLLPVVPNTFKTSQAPLQAFADYYLQILTAKGHVWQAFGTSQAPWSQQTDLLFQPAVSAVAIDNKNNNYYTVSNTLPRAAQDSTSPSTGYTPNSTLVCTQNASSPNNGAMLWRFRLPMMADNIVQDADGVTYGDPNDNKTLTNFVFSGAPVVDENGLVYAVAYNSDTNKFAVLCFNSNTQVTADVSIPTGANPGTVNGATVTQPVGNATFTEFGSTFPVGTGPITQGINYTADSNGHLAFTNFASPAQGSAFPERYPVMSEPQSIQVSFNAVSGNTTTNFSQTIPLHTNLVWYGVGTMQFKPAPQPSGPLGTSIPNGLTVVGDYAFFGDDAGNLFRVNIRPSTKNVTIVNRRIDYDDVTLRSLLVKDDVVAGFGGIDGMLASGNGSILVNGPFGVQSYQSLKTLGTDADRVFETDADGNLLWTINSTDKPAVVGGAINTTGKLVAGRLGFKNPTSISQIDPTSYLVADTGNNRIVEFDRGGNVINEITRFRDSLSTKRMLPGDPDTLNHPTSVKAWRTYGQGGKFSTIHYLIADTGNYRVIQIADDFNAGGQLSTVNQHRLEWSSQTYHAVPSATGADTVLQRKYAYTSADVFYAPNVTGPPTLYVVALINNVSVGPLSTDQTSGATSPYGRMGLPSGDGAGGTIVLLDTFDDATHKSGYINVAAGGAGNTAPFKLSAISDFYGYIGTVSGPGSASYTGFDSNAGAIDAVSGSPGANAKTHFHLRNPRFLTTYTPQTNTPTSTLQDFLLADDNGVFDLYLPINLFQSPLVAKWGMVANDYKLGMGSAISVGINDSKTAVFPDRSAIPFKPSSVSLIGTDTVNGVPIGRYLITQTAGGGAGNSDINAANNTGALDYQSIGGEIFTVEHGSSGVSYGGYGPNRSLSRPQNGGALQTPASAIQPLP